MARNELDYDHIAAVCDRLTQTRVAVGLTITPTRRGYAITSPSAAGARRVEAAFTQLGYRANLPERFGRRDQVTITGWSRRGLETRVAALHEAVAWLRNSREKTAASALERGLHSQGALHDSLRMAIERGTGIITGRAPSVRLDDPECAQLLNTAHRLEHQAADHFRLHVQAAETAVHLYRQHKPGMPDDQARALAITTACAHGQPPDSASPSESVKRHNAASLSRTVPTADGVRTSRPEAGNEDRRDGPSRPAEERTGPLGTPDEHPTVIAAHDQPDGSRPQPVPDNAPLPRPISVNQPVNRPGPARGPSAR